MPDRVKLPSSMPQVYRSTFKQICEQQSPASVARSAVSALKKDIRESSESCKALILQVSDCIKSVTEKPLLRNLPECWDDVHEKIDQPAYNMNGNREFVALAQDTCHEIANYLEHGGQIENLSLEMNKQLLLKIWDARFVARIPTDANMKSHLLKVRPFLEREIKNDLCGKRPARGMDLLDLNIMDGEL